MAASKVHINPAVLRWAREDAGMSLDDAAKKANISAVKGKSPAERLDGWERDDDAPTRKQLEKISNAYYRPILTFYMSGPPRPDERLPDFRTVGDHGADLDSPILKALERRMRARQQGVIELLTEEGEDVEPLPFIGRFSLPVDVEEVVADIRRELGFSLRQQKRLNDRDALFENLRRSVEEIGVFVIIQGNLGSYHTDIEPEEFRGFALVDPIAPFIIINSNDAKAARTFTLLHELTHLWLGESGISNISAFGEGGDGAIETLCNNVASEFLLPERQFMEFWRRLDVQETVGAVREIANEFSVSRAAAAHRLWGIEEITDDEWWGLYKTYQAEWRRARDRMKEQEGGPTFFINKRSQLGNALIRTVLGALDAGSLTYTRAARILGVNAKNFEELRARAG